MDTRKKIIKIKWGKIISLGMQSLIISMFVIIIVSPISCVITSEGLEIIGGDFVSPKIEKIKVIDDKHLSVIFSEEVKVKGVSIYEQKENYIEENINNEKRINKNMEEKNIKNENLYKAEVLNNNKNENIILEFEKNTEIGKAYVASGTVEDKVGNTLTFSFSFMGYNKNIPRMIITEVQPEYDNRKNSSGVSIIKNEYVEIMALENGNLYGLVIGSVSNGEELDYKFPPIEVKKGEIIIVHLRNKGNECFSETGKDLNISKAINSCDGVRDLWLENQGSSLSDSKDVIYLKDCINNKYLDGFMYIKKSEKDSWSMEMKEKINEMIEGGIFTSNEIEYACDETNVTPTKSFIRTDSEIILKEFELENSNKQKNYPVKFNKNSWKIDVSNSGRS